MKNKLIYKFTGGFILFILLSFFTTSLLSSSLTYRHELKQEESLLYQEANFIATTYAAQYYAGSIELYELAQQLRAIDTYIDCNVMFITSDGYIILDTRQKQLRRVEGFDPTDAGSKNHIIGNFYGLYDEEQLTVFYPVGHNYLTRGYIVISKPISTIKSNSNEVFNYNYVTMLATILFCSVFFILFIMNVSRPIRKITAATSKYAKGNFSDKINLNRNDEIGRLADSLDYMASEINNLNDYQKKFIANISHDFRSPLTSIKGYLEAMLDGTIPPEMQEKYLNIVITETERLTKLTNNLLTMNNVSDKGMVLDLSNFDIIDMIKKTIETFEGICEKKKIKFKLIFSDKTLMVNADYSKIQQVLYNLIDNAIKFSNNDSSIIISANEKNDKINISVKDFGIGIPKDSVSKIWERFYKSDLSRGKDKKGTGLGLSIVKDIITAHKEYIDVVSTEGVGTEFIFALPKTKTAKEPLLGIED